MRNDPTPDGERKVYEICPGAILRASEPITIVRQLVTIKCIGCKVLDGDVQLTNSGDELIDGLTVEGVTFSGTAGRSVFLYTFNEVSTNGIRFRKCVWEDLTIKDSFGLLAFFVGGGVASRATPTFHDCVFRSVRGGSIGVQGAGLIMQACRFEDFTSNGQVIFGDAQSPATIVDSCFIDITACRSVFSFWL